MKHCSFSGCEKKLTRHSARGLCSGHYQQWKRGEDLRALEPRNVAVPWLLDHVNYAGDECLIWPFSRTWCGRGQIKWQGKMTTAHRRMCILAHGEPPEGKPEATHSCGNGHLGCVNPKHLRWGSDKDNKADMLAHGTRVRGERQGSAKLTTQAVREIRRLAGQASHRELGQRFCVRGSTIGKILRRERWGHV